MTLTDLIEKVNAQDPGFASKLMTGGGYRGLFDVEAQEYKSWTMPERVATVVQLTNRFKIPMWMQRAAFLDTMRRYGYGPTESDRTFFDSLDKMIGWLRERATK